jgi:hypothetical protein
VSESRIDPELVRFINSYLPTVEHLEILLLLNGSSEHCWTVRALNDLLRSSETSIRACLEELSDHGLLEKASGPEGAEAYQFRVNPEADGLVNRLRSAYKERRVRVIETIYSPKPDPLSEFSRAFDFRKRDAK